MTLQLKYNHATNIIKKLTSMKRHDKRELKQWRKFAKDLAKRLNAERYGNL